jgi:uncharacterized protein with ATP-grasp and redox domains
MPTSVIKIGKYTNGKGTLDGQVKKNLVEWAIQAQHDIHELKLNNRIRQSKMIELQNELQKLKQERDDFAEGLKWVDSLDIGYHDTVQEYIEHMESQLTKNQRIHVSNGDNVDFSVSDYKNLVIEHNKLKSLYMKLILN